MRSAPPGISRASEIFSFHPVHCSISFSSICAPSNSLPPTALLTTIRVRCVTLNAAPLLSFISRGRGSKCKSAPAIASVCPCICATPPVCATLCACAPCASATLSVAQTCPLWQASACVPCIAFIWHIRSFAPFARLCALASAPPALDPPQIAQSKIPTPQIPAQCRLIISPCTKLRSIPFYYPRKTPSLTLRRFLLLYRSALASLCIPLRLCGEHIAFRFGLALGETITLPNEGPLRAFFLLSFRAVTSVTRRNSNE